MAQGTMWCKVLPQRASSNTIRIKTLFNIDLPQLLKTSESIFQYNKD